MKSRYFFTLLGVAAQALAEEPPTQATVVVTATRTAQAEAQSLSSVTVITREEIDRKQALSVQDALRGVVGLGVSNAGGLGKPSDVFLRGSNSDHVLVLVDGVRSGSPTLGTTQFQDIPIDQIERIEIVRGPRSSLYGSEAIGGVIQIFTRKGGGGFRPSFSAGIGSHDTYKAAGGVSGGGDQGWFNLSAAELYTHGFNACLGQPYDANFNGGAGCYAYEPDHDGYTNTSGSAKAGYRFANGAEVEGSIVHAEGENKFDGDFVNVSKIVQQVISGKLRFSPLHDWDVTMRVGSNADQSDNFHNRLFMTRFNTRRFSSSLQNDFSIAKNHLLTAGFDYYDDRIDGSTTAYVIGSRDNKAGFLQYQGELYGHSLALSVRQDSNQQFGGKTTGNAAWGYGFGEAVRLTASYGTAFKAPTFNDLYWPGFGNSKLRPEASDSVEVGAKGKLADVQWAINGYRTMIDDLIAFDPITFAAANIAKAEIFGLETQVSTQFYGVDIRANLNLVDPRNQEDGPNHGNLLPRRAQQAFHLDLDRRFGKFRAGLTVNQEGRRFDDLGNTTNLHGFTTLDLRAGYEVYPGVLVEGRAANLFNEHYQTAYLYNQMGTDLFLSVSYRPRASDSK